MKYTIKSISLVTLFSVIGAFSIKEIYSRMSAYVERNLNNYAHIKVAADRDGNGKIDNSEIEDICSKMDVSLDENQMNDVYRKINNKLKTEIPAKFIFSLEKAFNAYRDESDELAKRL